MGLLKRLGKSVVDAARDQMQPGSAQGADLLAETHFRELDGSEPFITKWEIDKYVADAKLRLASPHIDHIAASGGIPRSSIESVADSFGRRFVETLTSLLSEASAAASVQQGACTRVPEVLPMAARAIDDWSSGPRVEARAWAGFHAMAASKKLAAEGGTPQTPLADLVRIQSSATIVLLQAQVMLGHVKVDASASDVIGENVVIALRNIEEAERNAFGLRHRLPRAFQPTGHPRHSPPSPRTSTSGEDPTAAVMRDLLLLHAETVVNPLVAADALSYAAVLDRSYLMLRIQHGAKWSVDRGLHEGPSSLELDDQLKAEGRMAPIYFPQILKPRPMRLIDATSTGLLVTDYVYVTDPSTAYATRSEQMSWLGEFGFRSAE